MRSKELPTLSQRFLLHPRVFNDLGRLGILCHLLLFTNGFQSLTQFGFLFGNLVFLGLVQSPPRFWWRERPVSYTASHFGKVS